MTDIIQNCFISILNRIYKVTGRINEKTRELIVQILYIGIFGMYIAFRAKIFKHAFYRELLHDASTRYIVCTVVLLIIAVLTINKPLHKVNWRPAILYSQMLTGLGIVIISFIHPVGAGYRLLGIQLLLVFPCCYFIWNNRGDYRNLIRPVINAVIIIGIIFYAGSFLMAFRGRLMFDPGTYRLAGVMPNSNSFSLIGLQLVLCGLYLLAVEGGKRTITCFAGIITGMGLGIVVEGQMRIAILAIGLCSFFTFYYCVRFFRQKATKVMLIHFVVYILLAGSMIQLTAIMPDINQQAINRKNGITEVVQEEPAAEQPETEPDEPDVTDRIKKTEGEDLNTYTSGRILIWQNYYNALNLIGNNFDEYDPVMFTGREDLPYAHNIFLEIAYRCGVPVGLMAVLYYLICGLVCIKFLFVRSDNKQPFQLFPIIFAITFALEALLDCAVLPFFQTEALLFYIAVAVMIDRDVN